MSIREPKYSAFKVIRDQLHLLVGSNSYKKIGEMSDEHILNLMKSWHVRQLDLQRLYESHPSPQLHRLISHLEDALSFSNSHMIERAEDE